MSISTQKQQEAKDASFLEAGFRGWALLLAAAGCVMLAFCAVFSLVSMSLETFTLTMGAAAFAFSGACWVFGRLARQ